MGFDIVISSVVLGILAGTLTLLSAFKLSKLLLAGSNQWWIPMLAPFTLALFTPFVSWSGSGLETMLYALLITAGCYQYLHYIANSRPFSLSLASIIFALVAMTRPEGILFAVGMFFYEIMRHYFQRNEGLRLQARSILYAFLVFFVPFSVWFMWRAIYYQSLFPNTVYAKSGGSLFHFWRGLTYVIRFIRACWEGSGPLLFLGMFGILSRAKRQVYFLYIEFTLYIIFVIYVGGDYMVNARFGAPVLPIMTALAASGVQALASYVQGVPKRLSRLFVAGTVITIVLVKLPEVRDASRAAKIQINSMLETRRQIGEWLYQHCPSNTVTSIGTAGVVPYYSRLFNIDFSGINDRHIARLGQVDKRIGHQRADGAYVLARRPDLILIDPTLLDSDKVLLANLSGNHFYGITDLAYNATSILENPGFADYRPTYVKLGDDRWLQLFIRTDWEIPPDWVLWSP